MVRRLRLAGPLAVLLGALAFTPVATAAGAPQVDDSWVNGISATGVDVHASIYPGELETRGKVEYITAVAYQANLAALPPRDGFAGAIGAPVGGAPVGNGAVPLEFTRHLGGLTAATPYRYRVTASNPEGIVNGPTRSFTTQESTPAFSLLDDRGWEMVSPVDKNGGEIQAPGTIFGGGLFQAAADGQSVTYSSTSSFANGQGSPGASQYISRRGGEGWGTENVTAPTEAGAYGTHPDGVPFRLFSADLARGIVLVPQRCASDPCPQAYALRQSSNGSLSSSPQRPDLAFAGSSPDLSTAILSTCAALTAEATEAPGADGCDPAKPNLYRWSGGTPTLINLLPGDPQGTPGAQLAAPLGAVSADASRIYFTHEGNLYLRSGNSTVQVDTGVGGGGIFQTATSDGAVAFFTKAGHLYRHASGTATDLTPGGEVQGVLGASPDGSYLYYLTPSGLYLSRNGAAGTKVADGADPSDYPPATGSARVAPNGTLAFLASQSLTVADTGNFAQAYLYEPATGTLTCASCNPTGARPLGPSAIPGANPNGTSPTPYKPRALSADGRRLFFDSRDALVTTDTNNDQDVYEWEAQGEGTCTKPGGCVALLSSGRSEEGASFLDASADGSDAFFLTDGSLVPADPGNVDVYDARVGGGFPFPPVPIACLGDACQVVPGEPEDPGAGTASYRAEGNPPLVFPKAKKHKKAKRHGKGRKGKGHHAKTKPAAKGKGGRR